MLVPDKWVKLRLESDQYGIVDKILAGWAGGYAQADTWKISSGIVKTTEFDNRYEFENVSGSIYVCYKNARGHSSLTKSMLDSWRSHAESMATITEID